MRPNKSGIYDCAHTNTICEDEVGALVERRYHRETKSAQYIHYNVRWTPINLLRSTDYEYISAYFSVCLSSVDTAREIDKTIVCFCRPDNGRVVCGARFKLAAVPVREAVHQVGQVAGRGRRLLGMRGGHSQSPLAG